MRALCGAIITAGAMIGLGLTALAFAIRFQSFGDQLHPETNQLWGIPSMLIILVLLGSGAIIGLGIAFLGLAYHHERRMRELGERPHADMMH